MSKSTYRPFNYLINIAENSVYTLPPRLTSAILKLAAEWKFESIRFLAISKLAPIASPIDKIILGRKYNVEFWLHHAYIAVCMRPEPLTREEGRRLGVDDVIDICAIRQQRSIGLRDDRDSVSSLSNDVIDRFDLKGDLKSLGIINDMTAQNISKNVSLVGRSILHIFYLQKI